jgi:hypothetical protein
MASLEELRKQRADIDRLLKAEKDPKKRAELSKKRAGINKGIVSAKKGTTTGKQEGPGDIKGLTPEEVAERAKKDVGTAMEEGKKISEGLVKPEDFRKLAEGRTAEETETLNRLKSEYDKSVTRSPEAQLALDKFKSGLEGLSSQEGMALQEQARRNLDTQYQTQMAQAKMAAARSGARGAAAGAQQMMLDRDRARAQGQLEQDLTVQNYDIKQKALQNFGGYVGNLESAEAARRQGALGMLTGQENVVTDRGLETSKFNIGQDLARANAAIQATLGGAGIYSSTAGNIYATDMATKAANEANKITRESIAATREANRGFANQVNQVNQPNRNPNRNTGRNNTGQQPKR